WLPEYSFSNWFGIVGPAGMPPDVVRGLNAAIQQALSDPKVRTQIAALGAQVVTGDTAAFQALIERDRARWGEIIRDANIRIE
ncbi:MAG TPA: tripartite tricarboxylate transporter substrate-binding protein, partial [Bordetella sp.]|nr:tripartite tricarboxylate transporter substrate-binding protein [Bordetella sp.]